MSITMMVGLKISSLNTSLWLKENNFKDILKLSNYLSLGMFLRKINLRRHYFGQSLF
ncbi:hypothetical protein FC85_GL002374 [Lentilactobacillus diolivorans DSM 14421]|uniref:Uncharacterized protein n=1 Tax=Lentilactobacillus diolivorans DSM 14421 TaxID=1423739 RepID=A0A0R1SH13_9LACO|nr:hypothetical protein FC85_GL002374 [Lentilactobacillus diolivorans DSM 14421]